MPKFGTKNAWFGFFGQEFENNIWNQHPRICLIAKFRRKTKMYKFGTKIALFGYFWARILRNYCHIWNQHLQIVKNESLTHTANCGIGSVFSTALGSAFSGGPDPGPLYKVCRQLTHIYESFKEQYSRSIQSTSWLFEKFRVWFLWWKWYERESGWLG